MAYLLIKAPVELPRARRLAISTVGDLSHAMTLLALQRLGIGPKELEVIQVGQQPERMLALRNSSVRATIVRPPFDFMLKKEGFVLLFDSSNEGAHSCHGLHSCGQKFLAKTSRIV